MLMCVSRPGEGVVGITGRALRTHGFIAAVIVAFLFAIPHAAPRRMESRPGIPEGLIGVPIDAHTRVAAPPVERASRAEAGATFQIINIGSSVPPPALAAFQHALDIWADLINSPIPIEV